MAAYPAASDYPVASDRRRRLRPPARGRRALLAACALVPFVLVAIAGSVFAGTPAAGATGVRISDFAVPAGCALDTEARARIQQEIDQSDGIAAGDAAQVAAVRAHLQIYVQTWIRDYCARNANG
jgi:hypothetical protein